MERSSVRVKRKREQRTNIKWTDQQTQELLMYMRENIENLEKPSAQVFYKEAIEKIPSLKYLPWDKVRQKVRNLKRQYFKAKSWQEHVEEELNDADNENSIREQTVKLCPFYDELDEIFRNTSREDVKPFAFAETNSENLCGTTYFDTVEEETNIINGVEYSDSEDIDSGLSYYNDVPDKKMPTHKLKIEKQYNTERESSTELERKRIKVKKEVDMKNRALVKVECPGSEKGRFSKEISERDRLQRERLEIERKHIKMKELELELKKEEIEKNFEIKVRQIASEERLKKLEIEKDERVAKYELELKYKAKVPI